MRLPLVALLWLAAGCSRPATRPVEVVEPEIPRVSESDVTRAIPARIRDRGQWARDILEVMEELDLGRSPAGVCSIVAIIAQESGFNANPAVPGLADIVQKRLDAYTGKLGPLGRPVLHMILEGRAPGKKETFEQRLKSVKTEKDLDVIFRELLAHYEQKYPTTMTVLDTLGGAVTASHLQDLNPITTAGSMQVSVRSSTELGARSGLSTSQVRDQLYTRRGGVYYGTARLLGYEAAYPEPLYRFADYNSGMYASRNAAFQAQLSEMTGFKIAADGDILAYSRAGVARDGVTNTMRALMAWRTRYAKSISDAQLRRDALHEKSRELENTETWRAFKRSYEHTLGKAPAYARMPEVTISSPKMSKDRSTAWYARNVDQRFKSCLQKLRTRAES